MTQEKLERPCDLNKKLKRLSDSRENAKENIRNKAKQNKALRDRNVEISENRDQWRARSKELQQELKQQAKTFCERLKRQEKEHAKLLQNAMEKADMERNRAEDERKRADELQAALEEALKKKPGNASLDSKNGRKTSARLVSCCDDRDVYNASAHREHLVSCRS